MFGIMEPMDNRKKSGFVVLAGRSNVGKSTLLNRLVGSKVAIVTPKPQTTRHPVRGVLHDARGQIVFVDTPGVFLGKTDVVSRRLNDMVREQLEGIDAVVYVVDPTRASGSEEEHIQKLLRSLATPILVAINKGDLPKEQRLHQEEAEAIHVGQKKTVGISAASGKNLDALVDDLYALLPMGEPFYPEHQITDIAHEKWLAELIREKVFLCLEQELPYTIHVELTEIRERKDRMRMIAATIWTTQERYRKMIIGSGATMLKRIGSEARRELEVVLDTRIFLDLTVAVDPHWPRKFMV